MKKLLSAQHPLVKHLVKLQRNKNYRKEQQTVVIEGKKVIDELCIHFAPLKILTSNPSLLKGSTQQTEQFQVTDAIIEKISTTLNPEKILAEFSLPKPHSLQNREAVVACDAIQDPGNLGTITRTALALNWEGIFFLNNCCDPFNNKTLRASKGALFHIPYRQGNWEELTKLIQINHLTPLVADLKGTPLDQLHTIKKPLLLLSNEAHGVSDRANQFDQKVSIPQSKEMESLGVASAAALLLYNLKIKR